jgi:HK97 family phage major capsid protein
MPLTPTTAKAYREQLDPLRAEIRALAEKSNDPAQTWTKEDEERWVKVNADYDGLKAKAQRQERMEALDAEAQARANSDPPPGREDTDPKGGAKSRKNRAADAVASITEEDRCLVFQAWCRHQCGRALKKRHVEALKKCHQTPARQEIAIGLQRDYGQVRRAVRGLSRDLRMGTDTQQRAQSINVNTAGGYTIPQGFVTNLEVALLAYANVREWADVLRTDAGNDLPWPTVNDTTNKGTLIAENTQVSETDVVFGQVVFHAFKYTTNLILVPAELLEDSAFNLAQELGMLMGIRLGRIFADHYTFGTGVGQPMGYITAATLGVTTASATAIAADELYNLKHSVDPWYRPGAMWTFHDQILLYIKKLKDGFGRYLWQSSLAAEVPDTLDGDPIGINQSMASAVSSSNTTVCYGQMSKYKIRDVNQLRMRRLVERYADYDQEGFVGFYRTDANLLDAQTHPVKYLQQHS